MAFVKRALGFTFSLGQGSYGEGSYQTVTVPSGLWARVVIEKTSAPAYNRADIEIFGLPQSFMNQVSRIGLQPTAVRRNIISVFAGEAGGSMPLAFCGGIKECWPDFSTPTEAVLNIEAKTSLLASMKPIAPLSYKGTVDVVTIMGNLAKQMGYTLENNGVSVQLSNPYLPGTARDQAIAAASAADIYVYFEDDNGIMALVPKNGARNTLAPTISPQTGLVGYPVFAGPGYITLTTEYNPGLRFLGNVVVENSIVGNVNGTWRVNNLRHELDTRPDGPWFSKLRASNLPFSSTSSSN
jgi:hypothetical protein